VSPIETVGKIESARFETAEKNSRRVVFRLGLQRPLGDRNGSGQTAGRRRYDACQIGEVEAGGAIWRKRAVDYRQQLDGVVLEDLRGGQLGVVEGRQW
jgi:hypothetical protein